TGGTGAPRGPAPLGPRRRRSRTRTPCRAAGIAPGWRGPRWRPWGRATGRTDGSTRASTGPYAHDGEGGGTVRALVEVDLGPIEATLGEQMPPRLCVQGSTGAEVGHRHGDGAGPGLGARAQYHEDALGRQLGPDVIHQAGVAGQRQEI